MGLLSIRKAQMGEVLEGGREEMVEIQVGWGENQEANRRDQEEASWTA